MCLLKDYNYFVEPDGHSGPVPESLTLRVSDIYGHRLVDSRIQLLAQSETPGRAVPADALKGEDHTIPLRLQDIPQRNEYLRETPMSFKTAKQLHTLVGEGERARNVALLAQHQSQRIQRQSQTAQSTNDEE